MPNRSPSSKRVRPWDKGSTSRRRVRSTLERSSSTATESSLLSSSSSMDAIPMPFIIVDGHTYYADRFYLHTAVEDDDDDDDDDASATSRLQSKSKSHHTHCHCGAMNPPPLLDLSALVASLDLKAAILATYSLEPEHIQKAYPDLFSNQATVPTLVLHGSKGWTKEQYEISKATAQHHSIGDSLWDENSPPDSFEAFTSSPYTASLNLSATTMNIHANDDYNNNNDNDDMCSLGTQDESTVKLAADHASPHSLPSSRPPLSASKLTSPNTYKSTRVINNFPDTAHFSQITSSYISPKDVPSTAIWDKTTGYLVDSVIHKRRPHKGVHHCKYMLLFETSGSMVVVVSTANLTRPCTTDASWIQRFPAAEKRPHHCNSNHDYDNTNPHNTAFSDFGAVLANCVQRQMLATHPNQLTPAGFLHRYLGWQKGCKELQMRFDYRHAKVHLVPTVPGDFLDKTNTSDGQKTPRNQSIDTFDYGRQRVQSILSSLLPRSDKDGKSKRPWLHPAIWTDQDRLIVQPTSLGSDWTIQNLTHVVHSYLDMNRNNQQTTSTKLLLPPINDTSAMTASSEEAPGEILKRMDIVWPTDHYIKAVTQSSRQRSSQVSTATATATAIDWTFSNNINPADQKEQVSPSKENEGYLFLSSETFNKIDLSCLSPMVMFETSIPEQRPTPLVPHFKSICRLFEGSDYRLRKDFGFGKAQEYFTWFLLTSACLSRGAQGNVSQNNSTPGTTISYSNFELGVLFCSRLQGIRQTDRLYCWKPAQCSCNSKASRASLVHLPIPYNLRPARYQEDEEEDDFCETPYFHEITLGTGCIGNMLLTPYGQEIARQQEENRY